MASLGYESTLIIENIETLYLCILFYGIALILLYSLRCVKKSKAYRWLVKTLMWNMLLRFFIEGYLELSMACFINFKNVSEKVRIDDNVNYWFAFGMLLSLFCFPLYVIWFVKSTDEK